MPRVYADMVADLFHFGHVRFLKNAKENAIQILQKQLKELDTHESLIPKADDPNDPVVLVVGLHADADVAKYKRTPVMNMNERAEVIESVRYVDEVILSAPLTVTPEYLQKHKIDVVCHAHVIEEDDRYRFMYEAVPRGHFVRLEPSPVSTTDILARIQQRTAEGTLADHTGSSASEGEGKDKKSKK